jgi:nucleoside-diphosphate-sugar epimerase
MAVLVTGGTGLIGANVVRRLVAEGDDVVVLDRVPPNDARSPLTELGDKVTYVIGTVSDLAMVLNTIKKYRVTDVIHMAALVAATASARPIEALEVNIIGTGNLLEAARILDLRRVIVLSSSGVMGAPDDLVTPRREEDIVLPATGIYPVSKLTAELLTHTYRQLYGVDAAAVRPRTVYGPGIPRNDHPVPVGVVVEAACRGEDVIYPSGSDTQFDLTYVKDEANGIVRALKHDGPLPHYVYNISYGQNVKMAVVLDAVRELFPNLKVSVGPGLWPGVLASGTQTDLTYRSSQRPPQDITKARTDFGFEPVWPVARAIPDYVRWVQEGIYGDLD